MCKGENLEPQLIFQIQNLPCQKKNKTKQNKTKLKKQTNKQKTHFSTLAENDFGYANDMYKFMYSRYCNASKVIIILALKHFPRFAYFITPLGNHNIHFTSPV